MKFKYNALCVASVAFFGAVACKEKPKTTDAAGDSKKSAVEEMVEKVKEVVSPEVEASLSVDERAAKLGFAKYLPANTEVVMSFYNAEESSKQLEALKLYGIIRQNLGMGAMDDVGLDIIEEEMLEDEEIVVPEGEQADDDGFAGEEAGEPDMADPTSPWMLLGQEITLALGETAGEQLGGLLRVNRRMAYFQSKVMGQAAQAYGRDGNLEQFMETLENLSGEQLVDDLINDSESGIETIRKAQMPPVYLSFRAKDGELDQAAQQVSSGMAFFGMAGEMAAPTEFETGGGKFSGYKILGEKVAETLSAERESMVEQLGADNADAIIDAISKKNLVIVTGTVGDYVVIMMGDSEDSLKLAEEAKDSIVGTDELKFADAFADKKLLSLVYGEKEIWDTAVEEAGGLASYALGFRDGLSGGDGLGETRDIEEMLQMIADREKVLLDMGKSSDLGMIAYAEDGVKVESFGGYDKGSIDWDAKTTLAHLGDSGDNLLFLNMAANAAYDENLGSYVEAIFETAYAITMKVSELNPDADELSEVSQYTQLFDKQFREDLLGMYEAVSGDFADGLGNESAVLIDLKGSMPAIPGIPQGIVDEAKAPRFTMLAPVTDREKLASAWEKMNQHTTSLLSKVSEMSGTKIPMQKPISSERDGMTTWFFSFPFFQDDFLPSVTVSDRWFAASTSKTQALDLMAKAEAGGEAGNGVTFYVNFNTLTDYSEDMLKIVDNNASDVFKNKYDLEGFHRDKDEYQELIDACREFDSLKWTVRKENDYTRNSMHFKVK
ncbi:hypothetical protein ACFSSA_12050 [Luteolibacter algae]|uniref:DUF4836 family protein n=1 Tax=Luteolibacter algae TaxID=454151 RepID=A0ABW5D8M6_9BACT